MQFKLEKLEQNFVMLEVEVEPSEIDEALAQSYKVVVNKVSLPGFRKGHIPRHILEAQFGKDVLYEEALEIIVTKGYLKGLENYNLEPIDQPKLEVKDNFEEGKPFTYKVKIEVLPEVKLGQYKGLEVAKTKPVVDEKQVDERLKALQERHAELVLSEKQVLEKGDFAVIDFEGYIDGSPFSGGAAQGYTLEIGSGNFIPGFEDQLIGMKVNSENEIEVSFPEDYPNKELSGKPATFKVALKEIKVKEIPVLDDEFAQSVGKFENIQELKDDLRQKIATVSERDAENQFSQAVIDKAVENASLDVPETLIQRETQDLIRRFETNLAYQGLNLDSYLEYSKKTKEEMMMDFRPEAVKRVKSDLVLNNIAIVENIQVSDSELDEKIHELAALYEQKNPNKFRKDLEKNGRLSDIKQAILIEKTADYIKEQTKIIEK